MKALQYHADLAATKAYWDENNWQCDCLYCQNYRAALPLHAPFIAASLEEFGLSFDHALEISEYGLNQDGTVHIYDAYYPVQGTLEADGVLCCRDGADITLFRADSPRLHCPTTTMKPPFFVVRVSLSLPWVLEEAP